MSEPLESSRPDRFVIADASSGEIKDQGGLVSRFGVVGAKRDDDGSPIIRPEDAVLLDARIVGVHDMQQDTPDGIPDRRLAFRTVVDYAAEYEDSKPGEAPYNQVEKYCASNRSTREVDGNGKVALTTSHRRIVSAEDGRDALSMTVNEIALEPPASQINKPGSSGAVATGGPPPPGVEFREPSPGAQGLSARNGVAVQGLFFEGEAAKQAAQAAIDAGGATDDVARWASAAKAGKPFPPIENPPAAPSTQADAEPLPPPPTPNAIAAEKRPAGYMSSNAGGRTYVGLAGTLVTPASGMPIHVLPDGTTIGTDPLRHDHHIALDRQRCVSWAIADDDVADVPEGDGPLVKGWMCPDSSLAGQNTNLPGEVGKLRPVIRVSADQVSPPPEPPPPYVDPREKEETDKEIPPQQRPQVPTGPTPPTAPTPERGPGEGSGERRKEEVPPEPPRRYVGAVLGNGTILPAGVTATGELAKPVSNPQAQGRDFSTPGVPCPLATGGQVLTGASAMRGGTTGTPPATPTFSRGHAAVVHTGTGILIGPAQLIGGGVGGAATFAGGGFAGAAGGAADVDAPLGARDLAAGANSPKLADRFVDRQGRAINPRGFDPEADPRVPADELDAAIPVEAFPPNRRAIVRVKRENAKKREQAQEIREAAAVSGVERRRAQNDRDHRIAQTDYDRRIEETQALRDAAAKRNPPDPRRVEDLNRQLHRLGQQKTEESGRHDRQRERLDRSQRQLEAQRAAKAKREAAKQEQRRRREERARNPRQPQGGLKVDTTPSAVSEQAAENSGWIGEEEAKARGEAARIEDADQQRSNATNAGLSDEGRAALGLPPLPKTPTVSGQLVDDYISQGGLQGQQVASLGVGLGGSTFGAHNVLTTPAPIFGEAGGPASVGDALRILGAEMRAVQAVLGGAFAGPGYLAGNLAVQHENTPGNPPAPSTIAAKWTAGEGEQLAVVRGTPVLEVRSTLATEGDGTIKAESGGAVEIVREHAGEGVEDDRPLVLITERCSNGRGSGAEAVAVGEGDGWAVTHDGTTRHRLADGSAWETTAGADGSVSIRRRQADGTLRGGLKIEQDGTIYAVDEFGSAVATGGALALDDLTDVDTTGATAGDVPTFDGADWVAQAPSAGGGLTEFTGTPGQSENPTGSSSFFTYGDLGTVGVGDLGFLNSTGFTAASAISSVPIGASLSNRVSTSYFTEIGCGTTGEVVQMIFQVMKPLPSGFVSFGDDGFRFRLKMDGLTSEGATVELNFYLVDPTNTDIDATPFHTETFTANVAWATYTVTKATLDGLGWQAGDSPAFYANWEVTTSGTGVDGLFIARWGGAAIDLTGT